MAGINLPPGQTGIPGIVAAIRQLAQIANSARERLAGPRTYYVRSDGSPANTGLVDSAGGAFLTPQNAIDAVCSIDMVTFQVTIQIKDATYTTPLVLGNYVGKLAPIIQGNVTTPANVLISTTSANAITNKNAGYWKIRDLKVQTTTAGDGLHVEGGNGFVEFQNVDFGACSVWHMIATLGGKITATGNYAVSGNAIGHLIANLQGGFDIRLITITYSNSPAFSFANFVGTTLGMIVAQGNTFTNGGTVTGRRFYLSGNADLNTNNGGLAYIPGTIAGITTTGGQYE